MRAAWPAGDGTAFSDYRGRDQRLMLAPYTEALPTLLEFRRLEAPLAAER